MENQRNSPNESPLLDIQGVTKRFDGVTAVDQVDMTIKRGELISLIGPNGSGKTTMFNCITGFLRPEEGTISFKGENITSLIYSILNHEPEKPSNIKPQIPLLFDHIVSKALKKNPQERYQKAKEIMADMSEFVDSFASK